MLLGDSILGAALCGGETYSVAPSTTTPETPTTDTGNTSDVDWIVPTSDGCKDYLAAAGVSAMTGAALGTGQTSPFTAVMPAVIREIRGYITAWTGNVLSATLNSVPRQLERCAYLMIIEALQGRLPGLNLTKGQEAALKADREILSMIAKGEYAIDMPLVVEAQRVQRGTPATVVTKSCRTVTRAKMNGLI